MEDNNMLTATIIMLYTTGGIGIMVSYIMMIINKQKVHPLFLLLFVVSEIMYLCIGVYIGTGKRTLIGVPWWTLFVALAVCMFFSIYVANLFKV